MQAPPKALLGIAMLAGLLALGACSRDPEAFSPWMTDNSGLGALNCPAGFDAFRKYARSKAKGDEAGAPQDAWQPSGPVTVYAADDELSIYVITRPGHPAHPAVIQKHLLLSSEGARFTVNGCGYGDQAAFKQFLQSSKRLQEQYEVEVTNITPPPEPPPA